MTGGRARRLGAAAGVLVCLVALPGQAGADHAPAVSIANNSVQEGSSGQTEILLQVTRAATDEVSEVTATVSAGSAEAGDYAAASPQVITFDAGETTKHVTAQVNGDTIDEINETFTVALSAPSNATIADGNATGTIVDDDAEPSIATISDATVTEGHTGTVPASITVTLSAASEKQVTAPYSTAPGTATESVDFELETGNFVFAPGDTSETIDVLVKGDTLFEPNETFSVVITDPINATPGPDNRGEITITDDDSAPTPTVTSPSAAEGNSGTTDLTFEVTLPGPRPAVTYNYRTVTGTANGSDYIEVGGAPLVFPPGATPMTLPVTIKVKGDVLDETTESFTLELVNPTTGAVVATATGTITNDDNNTEIRIADASADEPQSGTTTLKFTISLSAASGRQVSVGWQTANGSAAAGSDYNAASGNVPFAPGETTKVIEVTVIGDTVNEENETVLVNLTGSGARLTDAQAQGTIIDKNAPPSLSISDTLARESEGATFTVTLAGTTLRTVTVRFSTSDGIAKAGSDYVARSGTLTFAPGERTKVVEVTVVDDAVAEGVEDFAVVLGDPANGTITKSTGRASIEASDQVPAAPKPPTTPPTTPPVAKPVAVLVPRMVLGPRTVPVGANGIARMLVTCQRASPITCAGTVELERAVKPLLKLGKRTFSVRKGVKAYASIKLSPRALKLLRKNGTLRAKVVVLVKTSAKSIKVSPGVITLKSSKLKPKPKPKAPTTRVIIDP